MKTSYVCTVCVFIVSSCFSATLYKGRQKREVVGTLQIATNHDPVIKTDVAPDNQDGKIKNGGEKTELPSTGDVMKTEEAISNDAQLKNYDNKDNKYEDKEDKEEPAETTEQVMEADVMVPNDGKIEKNGQIKNERQKRESAVRMNAEQNIDEAAPDDEINKEDKVQNEREKRELVGGMSREQNIDEASPDEDIEKEESQSGREKREAVGTLDIVTDHASSIHADVKPETATEKPCPTTETPMKLDMSYIFEIDPAPIEVEYAGKSLRKSLPATNKLDIIRYINHFVVIFIVSLTTAFEVFPVFSQLYYLLNGLLHLIH